MWCICVTAFGQETDNSLSVEAVTIDASQNLEKRKELNVLSLPIEHLPPLKRQENILAIECLRSYA